MNPKDTELIFRFLENELNESEQEEFKRKYETDPGFAEEVKIYSRILISLRSASRISNKTMTEKPHLLRFFSSRREPGISSTPFRSIPLVYKIAVVALPLLAAAIIILLLKKPQSGTDQLFTEYFKKPDLEHSGRGIPRGEPFDHNAFMNRLESNTNRQIDSIPSLDGLFYFAINCMEQYRFNEAIYAFGLLMDDRDQTYREDSEWYIGLCYLQCGRINDAIIAFSMIAETEGHSYQEQSLAILGRLR
jgi:hypothetical protein